MGFRADLRAPKLTFLRTMIELCAQYDWLLMDIKGHLVLPELEQVVAWTKRSNAYQFLKKPQQFFMDLEKGDLKI